MLLNGHTILYSTYIYSRKQWWSHFFHAHKPDRVGARPGKCTACFRRRLSAAVEALGGSRKLPQDFPSRFEMEESTAIQSQ